MSTKYSEEDEVFEINDFTTASEWERFIAAIEEVLHEWKLTNGNQQAQDHELKVGDLVAAQWQEQSVPIKFADFTFKLTHHYAALKSTTVTPEESSSLFEDEGQEEPVPLFVSDMMSLNSDFPGRAHCLVRWFGLREFVTLSPTVPSQYISSISKAKLVLSSLTIAANNTKCQVPLFLQISPPEDKLYMGVGFGNETKTDFEMAYFKHSVQHCGHLAGLLNIFKRQLGTDIHSNSSVVSVRFTYSLSEWSHSLWLQQPPDLDLDIAEVGLSELGKLPFGALSDPISELHVSTTWPCMNESVLVDSEVLTNLRPSSAPLWGARVLFSSPPPPCLLEDHLNEFVSVCYNNQPIVHILGHDFDLDLEEETTNIATALDRLTSTKVEFPPLISHQRRQPPHQNSPSQRQKRGPIDSTIMTAILNFIFPDALQDDDNTSAFSQNFSQVPKWEPSLPQLPREHPFKAVLQNLKSCGVDSLVFRLTIILCYCVHSLGGVAAVAHLWYEIILELRFRWDNAIELPGLPPGIPDLSCCLLQQKLQMLNYCICRKKARDKAATNIEVEDLEDEEEFYECEDDVSTDSNNEEPSSSLTTSLLNAPPRTTSSSPPSHSFWDKPEGRLKRYDNLRLLSCKNEWLYVPITQEVPALTEDQVLQKTEELLQLGDGEEGAHRRACLLANSLLSDMESFKAANPCCILEDFVRWYSPRDFIKDEEGGKGKLSSRMLIPGNLWQNMWNNAKPVPSRRQKRLFDDTTQAEGVLTWLAHVSPGQLCQQLIATALHAAVCRLCEEPVLYTLHSSEEWGVGERDGEPPRPLHSSALSAQLEVILHRLVRLARQPPQMKKYELLISQLSQIELSVSRAMSLRLKLMGHTRVSGESVLLMTDDTNDLHELQTQKDAEIKTQAKGFTDSSAEMNADDDNEKNNERTRTNTCKAELTNKLMVTNIESEKSEEQETCMERMVQALLREPEAAFEGGPKGVQAKVIKKLFEDAKKTSESDFLDVNNKSSSTPQSSRRQPSLPPSTSSPSERELGRPIGREYLLRCYNPYPSPSFSKEVPHRLFAVIQENRFRMCSAFTQDSVFC